MAFPVSPLNGATTTVNGITYTYSSATNAWTRVTISRVTASSSPPTSPNLGDEWYDTSTDIVFSRVTDGVSTYWLDINSPSLFNTTTLNAVVDATITGNLILGQTSNTQAITTTTGVLKVTGGVGVTSGNVYIGGSGGNAIVATGNVNVRGNLMPFGGNTINNIGSVTNWWGTYYGISTQAKYADLAENYLSDHDYPPGTVVIFGGEKEITISSSTHDIRVAGVISTDPAYLMNSGSDGLPVALTGRVPCLVQGPVSKGTILVSSNTAGVAESLNAIFYRPGCIIGKSLEVIDDSSTKIIEVVVGRF